MNNGHAKKVCFNCRRNPCVCDPETDAWLAELFRESPEKAKQKDIVGNMVELAQKNARDSFAKDLPGAAATKGQHKLQNKYGSPREFAQCCIAALGEISFAEAELAVSRYLEKWQAA